MMLECCGKKLTTYSTWTKSGRRALKAFCPVCHKKRYKILDQKNANQVDQPAQQAAA